jgi:23S rRNA pseudouridine1911/1915/1917 synthase
VKKLLFNIDDTHSGTRLDAFLASIPSEEISRSFAKTLIEEGRVLVNDKPTKVSHKLKAQDQVSVDIPEPKALELTPENIPLDIVYEDDDLMQLYWHLS